MSAYKVEITKLLSNLQDKAMQVNPDSKHNTGRSIGDAYFWDEVVKFAKGKSDQAWERLEMQGISLDDKANPGDHALGVSPSFTVNCKVSEPRRAFSLGEAAQLLNKSKFKIPIPLATELLERAKIPGKSTLTYSIAERA